MTKPVTRAETDLGELYSELNGRLRRVVALTVRAPEELIEDACQTAWIRLLPRARVVRPEATLSWLTTTASREALRSVRRADREVPLAERGAAPKPVAQGPEELCELRERLEQLTALPRRQQRLVWLQSLGFSYEEIAAQTDATLRTVDRQLQRARARLRAA